jgi:peptidoglycan/xylan/chitin deacetylase (PgdA/CDA1 family)
MRIKNKETLDPKTVVITFDDGYKDNLLNAVPILKKYNIPATFFITSGYINTDNTLSWDKKSVVKHPLMTWDEVRELVRMGFDIGAHTVNHINLGEASLDTARKEITRCKSHIEMEIDKEINTFAFPFGKRNCIRDEVIKIIKEVGFDCCCSAYGGKVTKDTDLYNLYRIPMYPNTIELLMELDNFMIYFEGKMNINLWSLFGLFLSNIWDIEFSSQVFSLTNVL